MRIQLGEGFLKKEETHSSPKFVHFPKDGKVLSHHRLRIFEGFNLLSKKDDLRLVVGVVS